MLTDAFFTSIDDVRRFACQVLDPSRSAERESLNRALEAGADPLGDSWMRLNAAELRRDHGETYTPASIVNEMLERAELALRPETIVDCGCGSGRFALSAAKRFPEAKIIAVDSSADAVLMCRANAFALGLEGRIDIRMSDFLRTRLDTKGPTLWISNPPYVRHHDLSPEMKSWWKKNASEWNLKPSRLAGLHLYFLLSTARRMKSGDYGIFITSAEWMDVNYGEAARQLLTENIPLTYLHVYDRRTSLFEGTNTTSVVFAFSASENPASECVLVINSEGVEINIPLNAFSREIKWSKIASNRSNIHSSSMDKLVPLGSFVRVHRGTVTGNNTFWVRRPEELDDAPVNMTTPIVSRAHELMGECTAQKNPERLKRLITLPENIEVLYGRERAFAERIVREGLELGINEGYIASHRKAWWSVKTAGVPPVLMTYMGRNRPSFVINKQRLSMLNVVHGLYPKVPMTDRALENLVNYLNANVSLDDGRMYAGGLVKFEPKETEAILVPTPESLDPDHEKSSSFFIQP